MNRLYDVSQVLRPELPVWPGEPALALASHAVIGQNCPVNVGGIAMPLHAGTHADAPRHYDAAGLSSAECALDAYIGPCVLVDVSGAGAIVMVADIDWPAVGACTRLLLRTYSAFPADAWDSAFKAISPAVIERLAAIGGRLIGTDAASLDPETSKTLAAHQAVKAADMRILEGLVLDGVPPGDYELIALPLKIQGADASPVRAVLREIFMTDHDAELAALDAADPLAGFRDRFALRAGLIYLDGNSLGALPKATGPRLAEAISQEWGEGLITSWLNAEWSTAPGRIGDKIARLLGADRGEIVAADSTSVNIFKALTAALSLRPGRSIILSEATNFPTDVYMMQGIEAFSGGRIKAVTVAPEAIADHLHDDVAVVLLTQVHYKTGRVRDMAETTRRIHAAGALAVWDLSHSAGAIEVDLNRAEADFAVGCGYKFLNGGPGAPAFIFAARRHHEATPVLSGWFGHARPFAFEDDYAAAPGVARFQCGTPQVLGLTALECGVELMLQADMAAVRHKSLALSSLLIARMQPLCEEFGFALISPRECDRRGSQVSYTHPHGYEIIQALKALDVIADFRAPDVLRFGLTPLYLRFADIGETVARIATVCRTGAWDQPEFRVRAAIT